MQGTLLSRDIRNFLEWMSLIYLHLEYQYLGWKPIFYQHCCWVLCLVRLVLLLLRLFALALALLQRQSEIRSDESRALPAAVTVKHADKCEIAAERLVVQRGVLLVGAAAEVLRGPHLERPREQLAQ